MYMNAAMLADGGGGGSSVYEVDYKRLFSKGNQINNQLINMLHKDIKNAYQEIQDMNRYWTASDPGSAYIKLVRGVNTTVEPMNKYLLRFNDIPKNLQDIANNYSRTDTTTSSSAGSSCNLRLCKIKPIPEKINGTSLTHNALQIRTSLALINQYFSSAKNVASNIQTMIRGLNWTSPSASGTFRIKANALCNNFIKSVDNINKVITEFIDASIDKVEQAEIYNCIADRQSRGSGKKPNMGGPVPLLY